MRNRRAFLKASLGASAWASGGVTLPAVAVEKPSVAITIDDFDWRAIPEPWRERASDALLEALRSQQLQAAIFVAGKRVDTPAGLGLVKSWRDAGHWVGNHTYSHQGIDSMGLEPFEADVLRNQQLLGSLITTPKYFRFPMLKEGGSAAVRDGMREFLKAHAYRNGAVTIDASDWYYSSRLTDRLKAEPGFSWQRYREPYLKHIADRAGYYDGLATELLKRKVVHTLLVHYNLINVLFLPDLLAQFRQKGWSLVNASQAFSDPIFQRTPRTLPAGESLVWAMAKESGRFESTLRYPGEDDIYEKPLLDALQL